MDNIEAHFKVVANSLTTFNKAVIANVHSLAFAGNFFDIESLSRALRRVSDRKSSQVFVTFHPSVVLRCLCVENHRRTFAFSYAPF